MEGGKHPPQIRLRRAVKTLCFSPGPVEPAFCIISMKYRNNTLKLLFLLPFLFSPRSLFPSFCSLFASFGLPVPSIPSRRFAPQISCERPNFLWECCQGCRKKLYPGASRRESRLRRSRGELKHWSQTVVRCRF